jgi:shikimate kinase
MRNIVLIGMPGSGKSTIGKILAAALNLDFCDLDEQIEKKEGKRVSQIFADQGEEYFRHLERQTIEEISSRTGLVIATGGGVVKYPQNIAVLRKHSPMIVFVNRPLEDILLDLDVDNRPLLKGDRNLVYKLYEERYSLYKLYSDYEVANDKSLDQSVREIIDLYRDYAD